MKLNSLSLVYTCTESFSSWMNRSFPSVIPSLFFPSKRSQCLFSSLQCLLWVFSLQPSDSQQENGLRQEREKWRGRWNCPCFQLETWQDEESFHSLSSSISSSSNGQLRWRVANWSILPLRGRTSSLPYFLSFSSYSIPCFPSSLSLFSHPPTILLQFRSTSNYFRPFDGEKKGRNYLTLSGHY